MYCLFFAILPLLVASQCPSGETFDKERNLCYNFETAFQPWEEALAVCRSKGYDLVSIHNNQQNDLIAGQAREYLNPLYTYWIGASRKDTNSPFTWSDGSAWDFNRFTLDEPENTNIDVNMQAGLWHTADRLAHRQFVCSGVPGATPPPAVPSTSVPQTCAICEDGWTPYTPTKSCYRKFGNANWNLAEQICTQRGAHLASIHSNDENSFVAGITNTFYQNSSKISQTWIGMRMTDGIWSWSDKTPIDYLKWDVAEPTKNQLCAMIAQDASSRPWMSFDCDQSVRALVCKKPMH